MQSQAKNSDPIDAALVAAQFPELTDWQRLSDEPEAFRATSSRTGNEVRVSVAPPNDRINAERILAVRQAIKQSAGEVLGVEKIIDAADLKNGSTVIVTAFTAGETLEREITRGPIHWDDATWMTMELAKILAYLHQGKVTYGALHPSNVFLASGAIPILRSLELSILGRPDEIILDDGPANRFMPPELQRSAITPRIDVYGLGAALRSMLAGDIGAFHANVSTDLPLNYEQTPSEILAVVDRATATNPADRYADAVEFRQALAPAIVIALERERTRAAITFPDSASPRTAAAAAAVSVVGGSVGAFEVPGAREATAGKIVDLRSGAQPFQVDRRRPRSNGVFDRSEPATAATVPPTISMPPRAVLSPPPGPAALPALAGSDETNPGATYVEALRERSALILITAVLVLVGLASFSYAAISDGPPDEIAATEVLGGPTAENESAVRDSDAAVRGDEPDEETVTDSGVSVGPQNVLGLPDIVVGAIGANDRNDVSGQGTSPLPAPASPINPPRSPVRTVPPRSTPTPSAAPNGPEPAPVVGSPTTPPAQRPVTSGAPTTQAPLYDPPLVDASPTQSSGPTATTGSTRPASTTQAPTTQVPAAQAPTTQVPTAQTPTTQVPTAQTPTTQVPTSGPALVLDAVANPDFESVRISFRTSDCASVSYSISGGGSLSSNYGGSCVTDHSVRLGGVPYNGTQLRPSTAYTVTITTTSRSGQVSTRNVSFTTKAQPEVPLAISNLRVSEITATTARVSFTANKCVGSSFVVTGGGSGRYDWGYPNTNHCLTDQWGTIGYFQSSRLLAGADNTVTVTARTKDGESVTRSITFFVPAS